jgi:3-oxoacyl-[acyl-carrier protein] reductase
MKTVLITGATSGIGEACVNKFANNGWRIIGFGRNRDRLDLVQSKALDNGAGMCEMHKVDLLDLKQIKETIINSIKTVSIESIINCAGIASSGDIENIEFSEWDNMLRVNLTAPVAIIQNALPLLKKSNYASIVNVSSIAGRSRSISLGCHYTTTKAGIIGLTRHLATELGASGIRVNCVAPSQTHTPMLDKALTKENQKKLAKKVPLGRLSKSSEQANVIYFLCTKSASYINGAIIDVNGGLL